MQIALQIMWLGFGDWVQLNFRFLSVASSGIGLVGSCLLGTGDIGYGDWGLACFGLGCCLYMVPGYVLNKSIKPEFHSAEGIFLFTGHTTLPNIFTYRDGENLFLFLTDQRAKVLG